MAGGLRRRRVALGIGLAMAHAVASRAAEPSRDTIDPALAAALGGPQRTAAFVLRDHARHPGPELTFFGLKPDMDVVEIWPGGGYWTEVLTPYLRDHGRYEVAVPPPKDGKDLALDGTVIGRKLKADPALYHNVKVVLAGKGEAAVAAPESADMILSFRNLHNWMADGYAPDMMRAFFAALKHGGTLGLEDHRGNTKTPQDPRARTGYVREDVAVALAVQAGFVLVGSSDIGANPKDTADWPGGVWTLPPDFVLGAKDHDRYAAIGEADNFVLKFRKP